MPVTRKASGSEGCGDWARRRVLFRLRREGLRCLLSMLGLQLLQRVAA